MKINKAIVTGAGGFVGNYLIRELVNHGVEVIALIREGGRDVFPSVDSSRVAVVECPLEKMKSLSSYVKDRDIEVFFHLAWISGKNLKNASMSEQLKYVEYSLDCMNAAKAVGCSSFIGVGSVVELLAVLPLPKHPNIVYGILKDCVCKILSARARSLKMGFKWCRLAGVYGPGDTTGNLVSYTLDCFKRGVSPQYGKGNQPYSFIHAQDVARALYTVASKDDADIEAIMLSGPETLTVKRYMELIKEAADSDTPLKFDHEADDGAEYRFEWFDKKVLYEKFGFRHACDFKQTIKSMV